MHAIYMVPKKESGGSRGDGGDEGAGGEQLSTINCQLSTASCYSSQAAVIKDNATNGAVTARRMRLPKDTG